MWGTMNEWIIEYIVFHLAISVCVCVYEWGQIKYHVGISLK